MVLRRSLPFVFVLALVSIGAAGCGADDPATTVAAGGGSAPTSPAAATVAGGDESDPAASPVVGLGADQLKAAIDAPISTSARAATGPVVDQVTLPDGTKVWRVRVPGAFDARSARVAVSVGERRVGEAVLAGDLQAITAVTTDGTGLTAGKPVSYQWEGSPSVAAGTLAVAR